MHRFAHRRTKFGGPGLLRTLCVMWLLLASPWCVASSILDYQVDLGPPPASVAEASKTRAARELIALRAAACGQEMAFLKGVMAGDNDEDIVKVLVAKVAWLRRGERKCVAPVGMTLDSPFDQASIQESFAATFHCTAGPITGVDSEVPLSAIAISQKTISEMKSDAGNKIRVVTFEISDECMKQQVNTTIMGLQRKDHAIGTAEPCHVILTVKGDWDVTVRDLVRIYHLSKSPVALPGGKILDEPTREHLFNDLLNISGAPWPDSYPANGCGNTEDSTGSPADRADERSWAEENFGWLGDLWDILKWLLIVLIVLWILFLLLAILFNLLGAGAAFAIVSKVLGAAVVAAIAAGILLPLLRIPETENHLLMINTSRYLINEMIIEANPADVKFFVDDQVKVQAWLLARLQSITSHDFDEYNSRPYQRYSIVALLNLRDFTTCNRTLSGGDRGCTLKTAATIVLDLATAKFAAASSEGRRSAPFRRLMEVVADDVIDRHRFTDSASGSDYMFGFMLVYAGQTSQLPEHKAEMGAINEMVYPATSGYAPPPAVMSVMLGEVSNFEQTFHHAGNEMYSRSPSFLVSAGGVRTPSATPMKLGFLEVGERCIDRGAALPTVLIPAGAAYATELDNSVSAAVVREDLLRIVGFYYHYGRGSTMCLAPDNDQMVGPPALSPDLPRELTFSQDHNVCVYKGFACGTNITVPPALDQCFTPYNGTPWRFMSSVGCKALPNEKPFFVAMFQKVCPAAARNCLNNWGFFEAVEAQSIPCPAGGGACFFSWGAGSAPLIADANAAFAAFRAKVLATNGATELPDPPGGDEPALAGRYFSPTGHSVEFDAAATMNDSDLPGVGSVNNVTRPDLEDWPLASGDIINSSACPSDGDLSGKFEITGKSAGVTIDFCDMNNPSRILH